MSVRIYQLSKELGLENNELIDILRERGFQVKSPSSTVDNISAESLKVEFAGKAQAKAEADAKAEAAAAAESAADTQSAEAPAAEDREAPKTPAPPSLTSFVKTKDQVDKEKEEAKVAAKPPAPPPAPPAPAARAVLPPPRPLAPPPPRSGPPSPRPASPPPAAPSSPRPFAPPAAAPASARAVSPPPASPAPAAPPIVKSAPAPQPAAPQPAAKVPQPPPPLRTGPAAFAPPSQAKPVEPKDGAQQEASDEIKTIVLKPPIVVRDLAAELGIKPFKLISELMEMGIFASINQSLDESVASNIAVKRGFLLEVRHRGESQQPKKKVVEKKIDEAALMEPRPPVVCVLGHVDHGKTTLLDFIRKASVVKGEAGGITQHIGAYQIDRDGHKITFLDTPGHAAFNAMRARGADVTDIAVLVVAADDGFKPQTDEALKFIQKAGVTPIVAINKIDAKGANIDRVKQQMQERGIAPEDWGGQTISVPVSALKGEGVSELLDMILLQAEMHELKANPKKPAEGVIIEAQIEVGRGPTATVIVQGGTLRVGDALVCGPAYTKVKALFDEHGKQVKVAPPSTPVRVIGWSDTPECGATFQAVKNEKEAKSLAEENAIEAKALAAAGDGSDTRTAHEKLFAAIAASQKKTLRIVLKADAYGSVEAIAQALKEIVSEKVALEIISKGVGPVTKSDVQKASAGGAEIVGFNVRAETGVAPIAKHHAVKITFYQIIYELIDRVREDMVELLDPEYRENKVGAAEVRAVFPIAKGFVAGCLVTEGRAIAGAPARLLRKGAVQTQGKVVSLRRVKDDVKEVRAGTECGIQIANFRDYQVGDVIEFLEVQEIRPTL